MYALIWKYENNAFGIFVVIISGKFAKLKITVITCTKTSITFMDTQKKLINIKVAWFCLRIPNICMQNMYLLTVHDLP